MASDSLNIYRVKLHFYIGDETGIELDRRISGGIMDPLAMLLKPAPFKVSKKGDPEQTLQDFLEIRYLTYVAIIIENAATLLKLQQNK